MAGTKDGDVTIPEGKLYFALPYFGRQKATDTSPECMALSSKEGTITVKQMGWNCVVYLIQSHPLISSQCIFSATRLDEIG